MVGESSPSLLFKFLRTTQASKAAERSSGDICCRGYAEDPDPWKEMARRQLLMMVSATSRIQFSTLLRGIQETEDAERSRGDIRRLDASFGDIAWRDPDSGSAHGYMEPVPSCQTMGHTGPEPLSQTVSGQGVQGFGQNPRSPSVEIVENKGNTGKPGIKPPLARNLSETYDTKEGEEEQGAKEPTQLIGMDDKVLPEADLYAFPAPAEAFTSEAQKEQIGATKVTWADFAKQKADQHIVKNAKRGGFSMQVGLGRNLCRIGLQATTPTASNFGPTRTQKSTSAGEEPRLECLVEQLEVGMLTERDEKGLGAHGQKTQPPEETNFSAYSYGQQVPLKASTVRTVLNSHPTAHQANVANALALGESSFQTSLKAVISAGLSTPTASIAHAADHLFDHAQGNDTSRNMQQEQSRTAQVGSSRILSQCVHEGNDDKVRPEAKLDDKVRPEAKLYDEVRPEAKIDDEVSPEAKLDDKMRPEAELDRHDKVRPEAEFGALPALLEEAKPERTLQSIAESADRTEGSMARHPAVVRTREQKGEVARTRPDRIWTEPADTTTPIAFLEIGLDPAKFQRQEEAGGVKSGELESKPKRHFGLDKIAALFAKSNLVKKNPNGTWSCGNGAACSKELQAHLPHTMEAEQPLPNNLINSLDPRMNGNRHHYQYPVPDQVFVPRRHEANVVTNWYDGTTGEPEKPAGSKDQRIGTGTASQSNTLSAKETMSGAQARASNKRQKAKDRQKASRAKKRQAKAVRMLELQQLNGVDDREIAAKPSYKKKVRKNARKAKAAVRLQVPLFACGMLRTLRVRAVEQMPQKYTRVPADTTSTSARSQAAPVGFRECCGQRLRVRGGVTWPLQWLLL